MIITIAVAVISILIIIIMKIIIMIIIVTMMIIIIIMIGISFTNFRSSSGNETVCNNPIEQQYYMVIKRKSKILTDIYMFI